MKIIFLYLLFVISLLAKDIREITLNEAIIEGLKNNKQSKISKIALEIANAQYHQALSANYPAINAMIVGRRLNENPVFQQRGTFDLPSEVTKVIALTNTLGIKDPNIRKISQEKISAKPVSEFPITTIPADMDNVAYGRDTLHSSLNILYPLFTGGKISSVIEQAKLNRLLATNKIKRDEQNVVFDIKKYFYGYVLTNELYKLANSTLKRMQLIENLTKQLYQSGESLKVKKTDYLRVQVSVTLIKSLVAKLDQNRQIVKSALINSLGLPWNSDIKPIYSDANLLPKNYVLANLVKEAYKTNIDIRKIDIALKISQEQIKEAKSGYYPTVGLKGQIQHTNNSFDYGLLNNEQKNSWNIGFMVNIPLFNGFKTTYEVKEKKLEKRKMYLMKDMLTEGIALLLKNELLKASIGFKQIQTLKKSKKIAKKNRTLNIKAYQIDAVEPEKVIEAQYIEAYVKADYLKYVHDYLLSLATIDKLVGKELRIYK